jgi:16S rRNA A1518/A1519 N6-dimethyltransferase RsmA/KsgA/DIM1 with predicted DNA glycosylase/AP lyase activity
MKEYFEFVKKGFTQRRKTLVNNMKDSYDIKESLIKMNLSESVRGEALTLAQWRELYEMSSLR